MLPQPISRAPDHELEAESAAVDSLAYAAVEAVACRLLDGCDSHYRMTAAHLLRSLKLTHQSMTVVLNEGSM